MHPKETAQYDIAWTREYGNVVPIKGAFGVSALSFLKKHHIERMLSLTE
jgi:hypothetical protein